MSIRLELPLRVISLANARTHWRKRAPYVRDCRTVARLMVKAELRYAVRLPLMVTLTRIGRNLMDDDNLAAALKPIRDGIADGLNLPNDRDGLIWRYQQEIDRRGQPRVIVEIAQAATIR